MKKTITLAFSALALAVSASAAGSTMLTSELALGDVTYTTVTGMSSGKEVANISSFSFTLSDSLFSGTQTTTNALTTASDNTTSYASNMLALSEITLVSRSTASPGAITLQIVDSSGATVASSSTYYSTGSASLTDVFDGTAYTLGTRRWVFSNQLLEVGETYTVNLLTAGGTASSSGVTLSTSLDAAYTMTSNNVKYQPGGMTIVTKSTIAVPEPATATLSLLALAGLAARRRRK